MSIRGPLLAAVLALGVVGVLVVVGIQLTGDDATGPGPQADPSPSQSVEPPRIADLSDTLAVQRASFCDGIDEAAIEDALGGIVTDRQTYDNGDPVEVGALSDISHEYGCRWKGGSMTARAWVFVPPVTLEEARSMVGEARGTDGCAPLEGQYGAPSIARSCIGDQSRQASYRGLFGDAWLTCTLTAPAKMGPARLGRRADRWCAAVAFAAADRAPE